MKDLALKKKERKSKGKRRKERGDGKRNTEWQTATKGPERRQLCHEAGKAKKEKKGRREEGREDWMKMDCDIIGESEKRVEYQERRGARSLTRGGIGRGAKGKEREKKGEEMVEKDRGGKSC